MKTKLEKTLELINNSMVDPDIDLEFTIPETGDPVILVHYAEDKYVTRRIKLTPKYLEQTPEEIANLVTFSIEQFKEELDSVNMG